MKKNIYFLLLIFLTIVTFACSSRRGSGNIQTAGDIYKPEPAVSSPYKVKVTGVYNDTHKVYDVDVIGLFWNGMEDVLKKKGMLWNEKTEVEPYLMEGHVVGFREGGVEMRWMPYVGDTVVAVRVELSQGEKHLATIESKRKIGCGKGTFTRRAWKKVFEEVSEDVVNQAVKNFTGKES